MAAATTYNIKLEQFEGPFDLLLFFIERDELDIYNIPITKITDDFLAYIRQMEALNIDLASEFILVGNEIDPREELVQRLLEYKRYKSVLDDMRAMEEKRSKQEDRGNISRELKVIANKALVDVELESLTLFKILKTFEKVMDRYEDENRKIVTFLGMLELLNLDKLHIIQGEGINNFWLTL